MTNLIEILIVIGVVVFQTFAGYIGNKYLGSFLPGLFMIFILYVIVSGNFTLRDILMLPFGFLTLIGIYTGVR
ncbi:hypothetical protein ACWOAH_00120 [Vagococcus vulneris]|uniref:hypothetical protein n=1 Tax=Vagococcus vulneris TaxID=1977869 RepID=UPI0026835D66